MASVDQGPFDHEAGRPTPEAPFDFPRHRRIAVDQYAAVRGFYDECAQTVRAVLKVALQVEQIRVTSVDGRGKSVKSFGEKAERRDENDANKPKYPEPLKEITDLAGVRIIVFLSDQVEEVSTLVEREFDVREREEVQQESGYRGLHLIVTFDSGRFVLPEYRRYRNRTTEIQIRTVLQHAWAEIEHGTVYKTKAPASDAVRLKLRDLAGALATADDGLQSVVSQAEREQLSPKG